MGGNIRHSNKGPDTRESVCKECEDKFTHGKYTRKEYCKGCEDKIRDFDYVTADIRFGLGKNITIYCDLVNENDVKVYPDYGKTEGVAELIGYLRIVGDNGLVSENVAIKRGRPGSINGGSKSTTKFVYDGRLKQKEKPKAKYAEPLGEDTREEIMFDSGSIDDQSSLIAKFAPIDERIESVRKKIPLEHNKFTQV